ncbi:MAG: prolipoprotein diacylglyceryl transferase [Myxococcales bacterium FL481]|nr:MAG: prolipoprotein diacylglyceryl transferase [Myxococcales bacterium FL481]
MIANALPYVQIPSLPLDLPGLGALEISIFGVLVATGVVVGHRLAMRHARMVGLDERAADKLVVTVAAIGFVAAHWVSVVFYFPERIAADPWVLLRLNDGIASTGGFAGGLLAFVGLTRRSWAHTNPGKQADMIAAGLLAGFTIGRIGCSLVHDHPGILASEDHWLAVGPWPDGTYRWDLGLLELLGLLPICAYVYTRETRLAARPGELTLTIAVLYVALRFPLDFLRTADLRYAGLTPAQIVCLALLGCTGWYAIRRRMLRDRQRVAA